MFIRDSISKYHEIDGPGSYTLVPSGRNYVIGLSIQQSGNASISEVKCGTNTIARNYGKDLPFNFVNFFCDGAIIVVKTGQDDASYIVTYIPENLHTEIVSVDYATRSAEGIRDAVYINWTGFVMLTLAVGVMISLWYLRRK